MRPWPALVSRSTIVRQLMQDIQEPAADISVPDVTSTQILVLFILTKTPASALLQSCVLLVHCT